MKRIHVVGTSGSGKTTVANMLARQLGIVHVELDALHWGPNWTAVTEDVFRTRLDAATAGEAWVADGNYNGARARDILWPRADTIVWLDLSRWTVMRQVVARTFQRWWSQEPLWHGNRERLGVTLFTKDSILWWAWSTHRSMHERYATLLATPPCKVIHLRTTAEVDAFLSGVPEAPASARAHNS